MFSTTTQPTPAAASVFRSAPDSSKCCTSRARAPSPGTVVPPIDRSPVESTSARTQRGNGSSTGASPAHAKRRMLSTGSTATGRGSALIIAVARAHPGGYSTGVNLPPTPQARSGNVASNAAQQISAVAAAGIRWRSVTTAAAPASEYAGTASATHFCASRTTPRPGSIRIVASTTAIPGPVAIAAGTATANAARISSGAATGRRTTVGSPIATVPSNTTAAMTTKSVVREPGTASVFQIPPRLAKLPNVPRTGSARTANARTPSACVDGNESETAAAASQGSATSTAAPSPTAVHHHRGRPEPDAKTQATATVAASISPV